MDTLTSQAQFLHQRKPSEGVNSLQEVSKKLDLLKTDLEDTRKARDNLQEQNTKLSQNQLEEVAALREGRFESSFSNYNIQKEPSVARKSLGYLMISVFLWLENE